jgi:phenylpropionate dioxygenase-like ring-hydroxylating dioxygenase large terminal subunit
MADITALDTAALAAGAGAEAASADPFLRDFWYLVASGRDVAPRETHPVRALDTPLLLGRADDGRVFALRDVCPHRGIPLRYGTFDGREVMCGYHGWRFSTDGRCTAIPSLAPGQHINLDRISCGALPCREVQGNLWVWFGRDRTIPADADLPPVPTVPDMGDLPPRIVIRDLFPCNADDAAYGLMDPTHAAFVHTSAWWKKGARTLRLKEKRFEPAPLGWRMTRHRLPPEHRMYRLLGAPVTTEISYALPGIRVEHIKGARHAAVSLTAITPVTAETTVVHQFLYWSMGWLTPLQPILRRLARIFLTQDKVVVVRQAEGRGDASRLMLIDDADTQAKWFARCKRAYRQAQEENRPFENPVEACTLRWRS